MRTLGIAGMSVTMPHKADVIDALDSLSVTASRLGAVNCIARDGDRLVGHNTDGDGLTRLVAGRRGGTLGQPGGGTGSRWRGPRGGTGPR